MEASTALMSLFVPQISQYGIMDEEAEDDELGTPSSSSSKCCDSGSSNGSSSSSSELANDATSKLDQISSQGGPYEMATLMAELPFNSRRCCSLSRSRLPAFLLPLPLLPIDFVAFGRRRRRCLLPFASSLCARARRPRARTCCVRALRRRRRSRASAISRGFWRGLSRHFQGKSQSFTSLASVRCVEDLVKPERPQYCRKKLKSCRSYAAGLDSQRPRSSPTLINGCSKAISKRPAGSRGGAAAVVVKRSPGFLGGGGGARPPVAPPHRSGNFSAQTRLLFA